MTTLPAAERLNNNQVLLSLRGAIATCLRADPAYVAKGYFGGVGSATARKRGNLDFKLYGFQ